MLDRLGDGVSRFAVGERVTVNPNVYCGYCQYCLPGRLILCENAKGLGSNFPGFSAEYVTVPHTLVFSVEGMAKDTTVFTGPQRARCMARKRCRSGRARAPWSSAPGPPGLLLAQLIATGGASSVTVAAPTKLKLDTATALGVDRTVQINRNDIEGNLRRLREAPRGDGYDVVVEATGSTTVGEMCVPLTRNGGTVMIYGVTRGDETMRFHPFDVFRREITIKGSLAEMTSFSAAIDALRTGLVKTDGIITHRFSPDDYGKALDALRTDPSAHKVVIAP